MEGEPLRRRLGRAWRQAVRVTRAVAGIPDYDRYLEMHRERGEEPELSRADFFRLEVDRKYGSGGGMRCC
ncbi:MAG: putative selenoprotein [Clostridia bacterium]|nr:putative selenoprotein [Clostridia bacterium]MCL6521844.1 putative selenoprotein [Bacillota bacterium]